MSIGSPAATAAASASNAATSPDSGRSEQATITPLQDQDNAAIAADFNPASLRLEYQVRGSQGSGQQQVTTVSTVVTMELVFDTSTTGADARVKPARLAALMQVADRSVSKPSPSVTFAWGAFTFSGSITALSENVDLFSSAGVPLRSTVTLTITSTTPVPAGQRSAGSSGASGSSGTASAAGLGGGLVAGLGGAPSGSSSGAPAGTIPVTTARAGESVQSIVARAGSGNWKAVASANGIDNPRLLSPGAVLDLSAAAGTNG